MSISIVPQFRVAVKRKTLAKQTIMSAKVKAKEKKKKPKSSGEVRA
jgi:hypothetical protein